MPFLDNRGLEPPEPMMRVLAAVEQLGPEEELEVLNDRRPMFLYPLLEDRGLEHETTENPDGSVRIRIRRGKSTAQTELGRRADGSWQSPPHGS